MEPDEKNEEQKKKEDEKRGKEKQRETNHNEKEQSEQEKKPQNAPPPGAVSVSEKASSSDSFERLSRYTILIIFVALGITYFPIIQIFFIPIMLAAIFAALFYPLYSWLYRHLWHKPHLSSLLCILLFLLGVLIPGYIILQIIIRQMIDFYRSAEPWFRDFINTWQQNELIARFLDSRIGEWLVHEVDWSSIGDVITRNLTAFATTFINRTYSGIFGLVLELVVMLFVLFFFFADGANLLKRISYLLPMKPEYQQMAYSRFVLISRATIKGMFIVGLVDGILGGLTLLIFGVESWLFWGFLIMIFSIMPLVGPSFVLLPAGIIQIVIGNVWQGIGILVVSYLVVINADSVVRPYAIGTQAHMHTLIVFFSSLGGLAVFGITGFIIGPIIASLLLSIIDIYAEEFRPQLEKRPH